MKTITIKIEAGNAYIVKWLLTYDKTQAIEATKRDPLKDNDYIINACDAVIKAMDEASTNE